MNSQPLTVEPALVMIERLREIIAHKRRYDKEAFAKFYALLKRTRLYTTGETEGVQQLWDTIREDVELTDFVVEVSREFYFRISGLHPHTAGPAVRYLATWLAESLSCLGTDGSAIDTDTLEQMHLPALSATYINNPWYGVFTLSSMCRLETLIPEPAAPDATDTPPGPE